MHAASRFEGIELSLIRQINALATAQSINLGLGEPNLEPDETLRAMAAGAAQQPWHYSPNAGFLSLRRKIAEPAGVDPWQEVCVTAGTEEALYAVFQAFVEEGDEVLIPNPGFVSYPALTRLAGAKPVTYDLEPPSWRLDPEQIEKKIGSRTKMIVINSPSNPLGTIIDEKTLRAVASLAEQRDCLVISDEIYREFWYDEQPVSMLGMSNNVIVANGMSKSYGMTGLRLGWLIGRAELMNPIVRAHQYIATCASVFSQNLAEAALSGTEWSRGWMERLRAQFRRQREEAVDAIRRHLGFEVAPPQGAFYAFTPVPECDTVEFAKTLAADAGVLVIPGVAFGTAGEGFVRISFAAPIDQIGLGIERVGRWMQANAR
jgi:aspartate aminotransferase